VQPKRVVSATPKIDKVREMTTSSGPMDSLR
jgi:hypothetical protein